MGGGAEEEDIPGTPNSASYSLRASLSSTRVVRFIPKNMHGAGCFKLDFISYGMSCFEDWIT